MDKIKKLIKNIIKASDWFINWAEKNKIKMGSIADNDLGGIYAQMKCNRDESGCLLECYPDLEKPIENLGNERLKKQLKDYEKALKQIASENDCYLTVADEVLKKWENK